ncbi:MAG: DegV family protein [Bacilli bacterium]
MKLFIAADSSCDIPNEEANQLGIKVIPNEIHFGEEVFHTGVDLSNEQFYDKLVNGDVLPKTSMISPAQYIEVMKEGLQKAEYVIVIPLSRMLSGSYNSALIAKDTFSEEEKKRIKVLDCLTVIAGQRIMIDEILKHQDDMEIDELCNYIVNLSKRIRIYATVGTLDYLFKGGRLSRIQYNLGRLINIKPVIKVVGGEVKVSAKAHGTKNAIKTQIEKIEKHEMDCNYPAYLMYGMTTDLLDSFVEECEMNGSLKVSHLKKYQIGPTIGTHVGPLAAAVIYIRKEN